MLQSMGSLIGKDSDAGREWEQEEKGTTEDEMARWHHRLDGREFEFNNTLRESYTITNWNLSIGYMDGFNIYQSINVIHHINRKIKTT